MGFHEISLPEGIAYGAQGGPGYFTQIIQTDGGREERIARRSVAQRRWTITKLKDMSDIGTLVDFFVAREGAHHGFRFKDVSDFSTGPTPYRPDTFSSDDVEIGTGDGSETDFQLIKKYTSGSTTKNRTITKPVTGKLSVEVNGVAQTLGVDYTVNSTTGVVTFTSAPTSGHSVKAGFQFDVPVRFSSDSDQLLNLDYRYFETGQLSIGLVEIIGSTQVDDDFNWGGAVEETIGANRKLSVQEARLYMLSASTGGLKAILEDPALLPPGGPYFGIVNEGGVNAISLRDHAGTELLSLAAGEATNVWLSVDAGGTKIWYCWK